MQTPQQPINSGFGAGSTTSDVIQGIDLFGKLAIVTGGYSGLGLETVRTLVSAGARVIVPTRDEGRASAALAGISNVEIEPMDLLDPASIDAFAAKFLASGRSLPILVNSAGIMACPLTRDARGYEAQFATNHLGHFQLVARLLPALRRANSARVVSVSSWGHHFSPVVFEDPNFEHREYHPFSAYGQSKTANILFALAVDQREKANGVRAFSLHPGGILDTNLGKHLSKDDLRALGVIDDQGKPIRDLAKDLKTIPQGSSTIVWCATSPQLDGMGGVYCENCEISPIEPQEMAFTMEDLARRPARIPGVMAYAVDPAAAERLWSLSEQLLGLSR